MVGDDPHGNIVRRFRDIFSGESSNMINDRRKQITIVIVDLALSTAATCSSPIPVSMEGLGKGVMVPASSLP